MAAVTRKEAIGQIQEVLKAYAGKIHGIRHDTEYLAPVGKAIVDSYCCNEENEQVMIRMACSGESFFEGMGDAMLIEYARVCRGLNDALHLGVEKYEEITAINDCDHSYDGAVDVAKYIAEEIKKNIKSREALEIYDCLHYEKYIEKKYGLESFEPLPDPIVVQGSGIVKWFDMVNTNHPWDHKPKIRALFKYCAVKRYTQSGNLSESHFHKYKNHDYFYDVWSNIHYGYVGRFCGLSEGILLLGSNIQQFYMNLKNFNFLHGDDSADVISIKLGINLYEEFKNNESRLSHTILLDKLEPLPSVGESRLLHKCFDKSQEGITYI